MESNHAKDNPEVCMLWGNFSCDKALLCCENFNTLIVWLLNMKEKHFSKNLYELVMNLKNKIEIYFTEIDWDNKKTIFFKGFLESAVWRIIEKEDCTEVWPGAIPYVHTQITLLDKIYETICKYNKEDKINLIDELIGIYEKRRVFSMNLGEFFRLLERQVEQS